MNADSEIEALHKPGLDYLRNTLGLEVVYHRSDQRSGIESGWPDLTILAPKRPPLLVEFKLDKKRLSAVQKAVHARLKDKEYSIHVVRSYDVLVELVTNWLAFGVTTTAEPAQDRSKLRQHLGRVWQRQDNGRYKALHPCSPADAHLPQLFGK